MKKTNPVIIVLATLALFPILPAQAQEISGDFSGGSVRVGNDTDTCDAGHLGAIRYNGVSTWEYCNATSWTALGGTASSLALNSLTAATATNTINSGTFAQEWQWNTLAGNTGMKLSSNSTAAATNTQKLFEIALSGANGTATQTTYGSYITNTHTGATSTNVGLYASASGATNNYAALFPAGRVGIGTSTPAATVDIVGEDSATGAAPLALNVVGGTSSTNKGGGITMLGGQSNSGNDGGDITLTGGHPNNGASGYGGSILLYGGSWSGGGGGVSITSGNGGNGYAGGSITLNPGTNSGVLPDGNILLATLRGNVGVGVTTPPSKFVVAPPASEAVAGAATITANACGTVKQITSTGNVTTNTTDTFTASTASYAGCCMDVVNVDTADTITLDQNAKFLTGDGSDIALAPNKAVRVCSNGTNWYQGAAVSSVASSGSSIDGLSDAETDYATDFNMFLGVERLPSVGGQYNIGLGQTAGDSITTGDGNIAIGYNALTANTTSTGITAIGYEALMTAGGGVTNSTALGYQALKLADSTTLNNTAIGYQALDAVTTSGYSTAVGALALTTASTSGSNTALGYRALELQTGSKAAAVGFAALGKNTGSGNVAMGYRAAEENTTAAGLTIIGEEAGRYFRGGSNTAIGYFALTGGDTVTVANNSGTNNIAIGYQTGNSITSGSSNILVGYDVDTPAATTSNHLNIGNTIFGDTSTDNVRIGGSGAVSAFSNLEINGTLALKLPSGTDAQRPGTPAGGMFRYNTTATPKDVIEYYDAEGATWTQIPTSSGGTPTLNAIAAATATNTINSGTFAQEWQWNTLAGNAGLKLSSTSTAAASNAQKVFEIALSGANATTTQTTYGSYITNTHTGTASTNVGLYASASGGTNNYAAIFENGDVGIGTTTPSTILHAKKDQGASTEITVENMNGGGGSRAGFIAQSDSSYMAFMQQSSNYGNSGQIFISTYSPIQFLANGTNLMTLEGATGHVGIGDTFGFSSASYNLSFSGDTANQTIGVERETTAATAGRDLTISAGGAKLAGTNLDGGNLVLKSGQSTGNGDSNIYFSVFNKGSPGAGTGEAVNFNIARFSGSGLDMSYNSSIEFNTMGSNSSDDLYEFGGMNAYQIWIDAAGDGFFKIQGADGSGAGSGDSVAFVDGITVGPTGNVAIKTTTFTTGASFKVGATDSMMIPVGTTAQEPTAANGMMRYDSTTNKLRAVQNGAWADVIGGGGSSTLNAITAATATNTINSGTFAQQWQWNTLAGNAGLKLSSTSTAAASNAQKVFEIALSGANATAAQTTYGAYLTNTHTGTTSTNVGLFVGASGGATANYAIQLDGDTAAQTIAMSRETTNATNGRDLTIEAGGGDAGSTDNSGGELVLKSGVSTGNAGSDIGFYISMSGQGTGTTDRPNTYYMGGVSGTNRCVEFGYASDCSGLYSTVFGYQPQASGQFAVSFGLGATAGTYPTVSGDSSYGIFMGDQGNVDLTASNTFGLFGGNMVIDPATPATQLSARGVIDVGAATTSIVLPRGTDAQRPGTPVGGMFRYNTTATPNDKVEYYDAEGAAWVQLGAASVSYPLLANPTGSAAAPAYSFNADSNTGMFSDTADTVEFTAGGTEVLQLGTTASGINYFEMTPGTAAASPVLTNVGTSTSGSLPLGLLIVGKSATTAGQGGQVYLFGGEGNGAGDGGNIGLFPGQGGTTGNGGHLSLTSGGGGVTSGDAGTIFIQAGDAVTNGSGGIVQIAGGYGGSTAGNGGDVTIAGGSPIAVGNGGSVQISSADANGTNRDGGNLQFDIGMSTGSGVDGVALFRKNGSTLVQIQEPSTTSSSVLFGGTSAITLPSGTDAERPSTPTAGMFRYNTDATPVDVIEYYDAEGAAWVQLGAGGGGGTPAGSDTQVQYNASGSFAGDAGMTYDATNDALTVSGKITYGSIGALSLPTAGAISSVSVQIFTTPGAATYTAPAGLAYAIVEVVGGGGGGGGGDASSTVGACGGGGGGGGYAREILTAATIGASQSVSVGAAGTASSTTGGAGGNGGDTTFGTTPFLTGGGGTGGTGSGSNTNAYGAPGSGGIASNGNININGATGGECGAMATSRIVGSYGGTSQLGSGGSAAMQTSATDKTGSAPSSGYGGGGSGGTDDDTTGSAGGAGAAGAIIVTEFKY